MKLNEITETGFYYQPEDTDRTYIYEVIKNTDEEWLKEEPDITLLLDVWSYDYTDSDDRKHYITEGALYRLDTPDYGNIEVEKVEQKYFLPETSVNAGCFLVEDKPTYKEKLEKIKKVCNKASTITQFVGGTEVKDAQKLALKILKIIGE